MIDHRRARVGALVVVVLALVVVIVVLTRPGREAEPTSTATATSTSTAVASGSATSDSGTGGGTLPVPAVVANPKVGLVDFTWSYSGSEPTDTFRVHVGTSAEEAQIADPITLPKAAYSVKVRSGSPACLIALVVRSEEISPASPAVCATAR